jgi:hypothetical protein
MITPSDFLRLPYTPDLTEGGIAHTIRSLPYIHNRLGRSPYDHLRRMVGSVAVELAFRRCLTEQNIPFEVKGGAPFTDPDRYHVSLGGHRCDIQSFLIRNRDQITLMRRDPAILLQAPALIPSDQYAADGGSDHDLYLFAFLAGLIAASQEDLQNVAASAQPLYLLHAMPANWCKPAAWSPLAPLVLKSESESVLTVEICGQNEARDFITCAVDLPPRIRLTVEEPFFLVSSIHVDHLPQARLGIHSSLRDHTHIINPLEWGNIWVYGMDILFTGYVSREEFRQRATQIQPGSRVFQYNRTRMKNLAMPIADLKPLSGLFEKVRERQAQKLK